MPKSVWSIGNLFLFDFTSIGMSQPIRLRNGRRGLALPANAFPANLFLLDAERVLYDGHVDIVAYFARLLVNQIKLDGFTLLVCAVIYLLSLHLPILSQ